MAWRITETEYDMKKIPFYGNKFLVGNGYFGIRGTMEEYKKENNCKRCYGGNTQYNKRTEQVISHLFRFW